jgi:2-(1,2-epoxy-1,2-dihydrophenyl)acetyl-CoA isomerase
MKPIGPFETLGIAFDTGVCTVTLARPDRLNAMNRTMRQELGDCFLAIAQEKAIRSVVLTGEGKAFSAGGDINDFRDGAEDLHDLMRTHSHRWFRAFWTLPQPTVSAVNGVAAGGGANLALGGDFVVASERASFVQTFMKIGLVPDLGGAFLLPRLVGLRRAKELALLGERLSASDAFEMGLVSRLVAPEKLMPTAMNLARRLAAQPPRAVALAKTMLNRSYERSMDETLEAEWLTQSFLFSTEDSIAGVSAFLGKGGRG